MSLFNGGPCTQRVLGFGRILWKRHNNELKLGVWKNLFWNTFHTKYVRPGICVRVTSASESRRYVLLEQKQLLRYVILLGLPLMRARKWWNCAHKRWNKLSYSDYAHLVKRQQKQQSYTYAYLLLLLLNCCCCCLIVVDCLSKGRPANMCLTFYLTRTHTCNVLSL